MNNKRIALFESKELKETVALRVEPKWEDMVAAVSQAFGLKQSTIKLFVKKLIVDIIDKPTNVRVLDASWPEVLDIVEVRGAGRSSHLMVEGEKLTPGETAMTAVPGPSGTAISDRKRGLSPDPANPFNASQKPKLNVAPIDQSKTKRKLLVKVYKNFTGLRYTRYIAPDRPLLKLKVSLAKLWNWDLQDMLLSDRDGDDVIDEDEPADLRLRYEKFRDAYDADFEDDIDDPEKVEPEGGHQNGGKDWVLVLHAELDRAEQEANCW